MARSTDVTKEAECPMCKGSGDIRVYDYTRGPDGEHHDIACDICGGTGTLPIFHKELLEE